MLAALLVAHAISGPVLRAIQLKQPTIAGSLIAVDAELYSVQVESAQPCPFRQCPPGTVDGGLLGRLLAPHVSVSG